MKFEPDEIKKPLTRLKRARGQLDAVIRMMEEGNECEDIVMQLSAVSTAIDRAGYLMISQGMKKCIMSPDEGGVDEAKLEKIFLSLA